MNYIITGIHGRNTITSTLPFISHPVEIIRVIKRNGEQIIRKYDVASDLFKKTKYKNINDLITNEDDIVIRFGCPVTILNTNKIFNKSKAIMTASNKLEARKAFKDFFVPIPKTYEHINDIQKYPVIIRPLFHRAGIDFFVCNTRREAEDAALKLKHSYYVSEIFPKTKEYRLHCAHGKIIALLEKPEPDDKNQIAWNLAQNNQRWKMIPWNDYDPELCRIALSAIDAVGLDFGAVDILSEPVNQDLPKHVVCEINTAPSFSPYEMQRYGLYFSLLFHDPHMEHYDFNGWEKGKSFSWKNKQLNIEENVG